MLNSSSHLYSDLQLKPVGTLEVKLIQGKELTNKDIVGKSDPFAEVFIRPQRQRIKKSKVIVRDLKLTLVLILVFPICNNPT